MGDREGTLVLSLSRRAAGGPPGQIGLSPIPARPIYPIHLLAVSPINTMINTSWVISDQTKGYY